MKRIAPINTLDTIIIFILCHFIFAHLIWGWIVVEYQIIEIFQLFFYGVLLLLPAYWIWKLYLRQEDLNFFPRYSKKTPYHLFIGSTFGFIAGTFLIHWFSIYKSDKIIWSINILNFSEYSLHMFFMRFVDFEILENLLLIVILTPIIEELYFRNFLQRFFQEVSNAPLAIAGSSVLFLVVHYMNIHSSGGSIVIFMLPAFMFSILYYYFGWWASCSGHAVYNLLVTLHEMYMSSLRGN